jgi:hypothetical protein
MWQKTAPLEAVFGSLSTQKSLHRRSLVMFSLSLPPPSSSSEAYFGSTSSVPRMDSSRSTQPGHGSRYIWDRVPNQSSRLPPSSSFLSVLPQYPRRPPSSLLLSKLKLLISFEIPSMNEPSSQSLSIAPRLHWTDPVSREETLARREQFRKISRRPPNHKSSTKKVAAYAKGVWERYVTHCVPHVRCKRLTAYSQIL